jgi:hypothetical protein
VVRGRLVRPNPVSANTSLPCGGIRPLDLDIPEKSLRNAVLRALLRETGLDVPFNAHCIPIRHRSNSAKCALLLRCNDVRRSKGPTVVGLLGRVEFISYGSALVVDGWHKEKDTGEIVPLGWTPRPFWEIKPLDLPVLTPAMESVIIDVALELIPGAKLSGTDAATVPRRRTPSQWDISAPISTACLDAVVRNLDNTVRDLPAWMAVALAFYAATCGQDYGLEAFERWSDKLPESERVGPRDPNRRRRLWQSIRRSPPTRTGAGALIERVRRQPGYSTWNTWDDPFYPTPLARRGEPAASTWTSHPVDWTPRSAWLDQK